jgi:hypothetical protein
MPMIIQKPKHSNRRAGEIDAILTPPRTQYTATWGKPAQRKLAKSASFAMLCNPLQRMSYPS